LQALHPRPPVPGVLDVRGRHRVRQGPRVRVCEQLAQLDRARPHPLPRLPPRAGRAPRLHDARRRLERRRLPPLRTKDPGSVDGVRRAPGNVSGTKRSGSAGFAAVLGAASLFSWGFILVKAAGLPPATTAVWRLLLALLVLLAAADRQD